MRKLLSDWLALIERHLLHLRRIRQRLVALTLLPTVFTLVFGVLFGSVISVPGGGYAEFVMAGIFLQLMLSSVPNSAIGAIEDLRTGLVDRFRSLPMAGSAVLVGRSAGDTSVRAISCVPMSLVGLLIGWRVHTGPWGLLAGFAVLLSFGLVMAWVGALVGLVSGTPETAASLPGLILMPAMFLSNAFIPLGGLPDWLQAIAVWNPLSAVVGAARELWGNPAALVSDAFPVRQPLLASVIWLVLIMAVVAPLAIRRYRTAIVH